MNKPVIVNKARELGHAVPDLEIIAKETLPVTRAAFHLYKDDARRIVEAMMVSLPATTIEEITRLLREADDRNL